MAIWAGQVSTAWAQLDPNDPWPKFAHDERNTCRYMPPSGADPWIGRGPHSTPELRWWADLGLPGNANHRGGAAVFKVNGVRYVAVTSPAGTCGTPVDGKLRIFRFHPCNPNYSIDGASGGPAPPVAERTFSGTCTGVLGTTESYAGRSTPLVLSNDVIVLALSGSSAHLDAGGLWAGDLSELECPTGSIPTIPEEWWEDTPNFTGFTSPTIAPYTQNTPWQIVVNSGGRIYSRNPANGDGLWNSAALVVDAVDDATPAIGQDGEGAWQIYAAMEADGDAEPPNQHFHLLPAVGSGTSQAPFWSSSINLRYDGYCTEDRGGRLPIGTLGSPGVPDHGLGPVIGSDDGAMYAFTNDDAGSGSNNERWPAPACNAEAPFAGDPADTRFYVSSTAGLTEDDGLIFWSEANRLFHFVDEGTSFTRSHIDLQVSDNGNMVFGAPVLDTASRVFIATVGDGSEDHDKGVLAFTYDASGFDDPERWFFEPPSSLNYGSPPGTTVNLKRAAFAPLAMDEDGTIYVVNEGYLLALRPLLGDLNGDGVLSCDDVDPFVLALVDDYYWENEDPEDEENTGFGSRLGVNLIGVGDCNNDGVVSNFDIDCMQIRLCGDCPGACPEEGFFGDGEHAARFDWLREYFQME